MLPAPFVIEMPVPDVNVVLVSVFPDVLPTRISPFAKETCPVPPLDVGRVPVTEVDNEIFVSVLFAPLIVLLINVDALLLVRILDGVMILERVAILVYLLCKFHFLFINSATEELAILVRSLHMMLAQVLFPLELLLEFHTV